MVTGVSIPIIDESYTRERCVADARREMAARGLKVVGDPVVRKVPSKWDSGPRFEWSIYWDDPREAKPAADDDSSPAVGEADEGGATTDDAAPI